MSYTTHYNPTKTPQSEPIPGREADMTPNRAGGVVFTLDKWKQLERFLILGSEGSTYYASEQEMTIDNAKAAMACIKEDACRAACLLNDVRSNNRAPKLKPLFFVLALLCRFEDRKCPEYAGHGYTLVPVICKTASHLFEWVAMMDDLGGWGSGFRNAIMRWYRAHIKNGDLAYQMIKYRQRAGWTHRDLLRKCKPKPKTPDEDRLFAFGAGKDWRAKGEEKLFELFEKIQGEGSDGVAAWDAAKAVRSGFPWEAIPSNLMRHRMLNTDLLTHMPMGAMIRQLGRMSSLETFFKPMGKHEGIALKRLSDDSVLKANVHPINVLAALLTYKNGQGSRGKLTWDVNQKIVGALDNAFYASFGSIAKTDKRIYIGLDVSGSMTCGELCGIPGLDPRTGAAAMAMVFMRMAAQYHVAGFTGQMQPLPFTDESRLVDVLRICDSLPFGQTDCAVPMLDALKQKIEADAFVILTDNETWFGSIHPMQALAKYRQAMQIDAKLIVVAMTSTGYTIADPADGRCLDVVGFDTAVPSLVQAFITEH